ncbi:MAG: hypothetical protein KGI47_03760 [Betaproteobacteria bacterium]|nr:hypothetical protein [Betaproteobacteria bacterium]MDE2621968.1 hypothetical protein [Betaproteobacteria bacterium]
MDRNGFPGEVRLRHGSSRTLAAALIAGHMSGAGGLLFLKWDAVWLRLVLLGLGVSLVFGLRREAWRCAPGSVTQLSVHGGGRMLLVRRDGRRTEGVLMPGSFVAPFLVIMRWRRSGGRRIRHVTVAADGTGVREHRLLRVLLRHPL